MAQHYSHDRVPSLTEFLAGRNALAIGTRSKVAFHDGYFALFEKTDRGWKLIEMIKAGAK